LQGGFRRLSRRLTQLVQQQLGDHVQAGHEVAMPSASCGVSASTAHDSSAGESRLAVRSPIASCMAAATVSPLAVCTAAVCTAAGSPSVISPGLISPAMICTAAVWPRTAAVPGPGRAFPRSRRRRGRQRRRAGVFVGRSCRPVGVLGNRFWGWILIPGNTRLAGMLFIADCRAGAAAGGRSETGPAGRPAQPGMAGQVSCWTGGATGRGRPGVVLDSDCNRAWRARVVLVC